MKKNTQILSRNYKIVALIAVVLLASVAITVYLTSRSKTATNPALESYHNQLPELKKKAESNPDNYAANKEYAHALYVTRNNQEAIEAYHKVVELNQEDARAYNNLGNIHRSEKRFEEAAAAYQKSIEVEADQINAYVNLANLYIYDLNKPEEGYAVFDQVIAVHPENLDIKEMYGKILTKFNQTEKAEAVYRSILEIDPNHTGANESLN